MFTEKRIGSLIYDEGSERMDIRFGLEEYYGCLIFNKRYPVDAEVSLPEQEEVMKTVGQIRELLILIL